MTQIDFGRARSFLVDHALPFWSSTGRYENGCFVERLDLSGTPVDPGFTRLRVQARQLYALCHAQTAGLFDAPDICDRSAAFFMDAGWLGPDRGWARRVSREGTLIDASFDFYDVSFALFALGWYYRLSGDPRCLELAHETIDFLEQHARHPAGGFYNDASRTGPRQQNPHMHFVEALNIWFEATGEARFAIWSESILTLFETRFCDSATGALFEFFSDDWSALPGPEGQIVEPGHQFEWAWIIAHNGRLTGRTRPELMRQLMAHALAYGYDPKTGLTIDAVDGSGRVTKPSHRLWPQTEALKAALAEQEFLGVDTTARVNAILTALFDRFLDAGPLRGTWIDHYDADWSPIVDQVPASSLYHVSLAFFELLRREPALGGAPVLEARI